MHHATSAQAQHDGILRSYFFLLANYVYSENSQKLGMPSVLKLEKDYDVTVG